jgi:hypothetical protein
MHIHSLEIDSKNKSHMSKLTSGGKGSTSP